VPVEGSSLALGWHWRSWGSEHCVDMIGMISHAAVGLVAWKEIVTPA
jgi:hypothetical protein